MEVTFHNPVEVDRFSRLAGVRLVDVQRGGSHLHLAVRGDLHPLLVELSNLPVDDLVFGPADLESVFLQYFTSGTQPAAEREPVEAPT
jgi:hypothetical protein